MPKDGENKGTTDSVRAAAKNSDTERDGSEAERGSADRLHESAYGAAQKEKFVPKSYFEIKNGYTPNTELEQNISRRDPSLRFELQRTRLGFERVSGLVDNIEQAKEFQVLRRTVDSRELSAAQELYLIDLCKNKGMSLAEKQRSFNENSHLFDAAETLRTEVRQSRRFVNDGTFPPQQRYEDFQYLLKKKSAIYADVNEVCANMEPQIKEALAEGLCREYLNYGLETDPSFKNRVKNGFDPAVFREKFLREIVDTQDDLDKIYKEDPNPEYVRQEPLEFYKEWDTEGKDMHVDDILTEMDREMPEAESEALEKLELISKPEPSGGNKDGSGSEGAAGAERVAEKNESEKAREKAEKLTQEKETQTRKGRNGSGIVGKIGKGGSLAILLGVGFEIINKNSAASSDSSPLIGGR